MNLTGLITLLAVLVGTSTKPPLPQQSAIDESPQLLELARSQGIEQIGEDPPPVFLYTFTRGGQRRESLLLLPNGVFEVDIGSSSWECVSLVASMPFNLGDGAVLIVSVDDGNVLQQAVRLLLDPVHIREHRAWLPVRFELPGNQSGIQLRFEIEAGVRGDTTADWVGIAPGPETECLFGAAFPTPSNVRE